MRRFKKSKVSYKRFKKRNKTSKAIQAYKTEQLGIYRINCSSRKNRWFFKLRAVDRITTPDANAEYSISYALTDPSLYLSLNGGAFSGSLSDWSSFVAIFDNYRVLGVKLEITPLTGGATLDHNATLNATSMYGNPLVTYTDVDDPGPTTATTNTGVHYDNFKVLPRYQKSVQYIKLMSYDQSGAPSKFIDTANPVNFACHHIVIPPIDTTSTVNVISLQVTCEYYVQFMGRR